MTANGPRRYSTFVDESTVINPGVEAVLDLLVPAQPDPNDLLVAFSWSMLLGVGAGFGGLRVRLLTSADGFDDTFATWDDSRVFADAASVTVKGAWCGPALDGADVTYQLRVGFQTPGDDTSSVALYALTAALTSDGHAVAA